MTQPLTLIDNNLEDRVKDLEGIVEDLAVASHAHSDGLEMLMDKLIEAGVFTVPEDLK